MRLAIVKTETPFLVDFNCIVQRNKEKYQQKLGTKPIMSQMDKLELLAQRCFFIPCS